MRKILLLVVALACTFLLQAQTMRTIFITGENFGTPLFATRGNHQIALMTKGFVYFWVNILDNERFEGVPI
jgi:hypothetical protein